MERNWLIRTSQNQILGPVAKAKVLEFLQKGALGLNDEVTSGNGYWFSLKEKDLVDKYLYGDVPQGYNPISESKSVLSRRENPDKTTSLNTAPANKTQVMRPGSQAPGVLPAEDDLEYPDFTMVNNNLAAQLHSSESAPSDEIKLPPQDDLAFPDITLIANTIKNNPQAPLSEDRPSELKSSFKEAVEAPVDNEVAIYPEGNDLDYPEVKEIPSSPEIKSASSIAKKTKDFDNDFDNDSGLTLVFNTVPEEKVEKIEKIEKIDKLQVLSMAKREKSKDTHSEERKLLHERKTKASSSKEPGDHEGTKDLPKDLPVRTMPEHLKKRNDNYLMYVLVILVLIILSLFFYYYRNILNKPLPV